MSIEVGDLVDKPKGWYYKGIVVAKFTTTILKELRYVVENIGENKGQLFIFNTEQLRKLNVNS